MNAHWRRFTGSIKVCLFCITALMLLSCGQWKVSSLKGKKQCSIENGKEPGEIAIDYDKNGALNLSFNIRIFNGKIFTSDNIRKQVQVLDLDGTPRLIIGKKSNVKDEEKKIKRVPFNFSIIGALVVDSKENIYVQNRLLPTGAPVKRGIGHEIDFVPSYILVFDKNGNLQYTLGQRGTPDVPFYYIEDLYIDKNDRLFVISRSFESWTIYRFKEKNRDYYQNLGSISFEDKEGESVYSGKIENIKIFHNGLKFLISVAYYHESRFKYRKIYDFSVESRAIDSAIITMPDPNNELFTLSTDNNMYFWNVDNKKIKFMIVNQKGNVTHNLLIRLKDNMLFEDIFHDENSDIYSYHVGSKKIDVIAWK